MGHLGEWDIQVNGHLQIGHLSEWVICKQVIQVNGSFKQMGHSGEWGIQMNWAVELMGSEWGMQVHNSISVGGGGKLQMFYAVYGQLVVHSFCTEVYTVKFWRRNGSEKDDFKQYIACSVNKVYSICCICLPGLYLYFGKAPTNENY